MQSAQYAVSVIWGAKIGNQKVKRKLNRGNVAIDCKIAATAHKIANKEPEVQS